MPLFTAQMKMADLIAANHRLILLLPRLNIPLGFGEKSVREVCNASQVPVDFMLLMCNVYTDDCYLPTLSQMEAIDMQLLVPYLCASHRYYTEERLPHIEAHLNHIADRVGGRYGDILKQFYADFRRQITEHFQLEESNDFPQLQSLQQGKKVRHRAPTHAERSHTMLVDKLNDLTQIVYKYLPGNVLPEETWELVFDILQLSADIQKHARIEEKILIPYMEWLERSVR